MGEWTQRWLDLPLYVLRTCSTYPALHSKQIQLRKQEKQEEQEGAGRMALMGARTDLCLSHTTDIQACQAKKSQANANA